MSSGPFVRTVKNTKLTKNEQISQINQSQSIKNTNNSEQKNTFVYKPPVRLTKNNLSTNSVQQQIIKKQEQTTVVTKQIQTQSQTKIQQKKQSHLQTTPKKIIRRKDNQNSGRKQEKQSHLSSSASRIQRTSHLSRNSTAVKNEQKQSQEILSISISKNQDAVSNDDAVNTSRSSFYKKNILQKQTAGLTSPQTIRYLQKAKQNKPQPQKTSLNNSQNDNFLKVQIKRPKIIIFNLKKLYLSKVLQYFQSIKSYQNNNRSNKLTSISLKSINKIANRYEKQYLIKSVLNKLKMIYVKQLKIQSAKVTNPKLFNSLPSLIQKRNSLFCKVIQNLIFKEKSAYKISFKRIKDYSLMQKNKNIPLLRVLSYLESKKIRNYFNKIKQHAEFNYPLKRLKLLRIIEICNSSLKTILFNGFMKISFSTRITSQVRNEVNQTSQTKKFQKQIQELENKISKLKQNKTQSNKNEKELKSQVQKFQQLKLKSEQQNTQKSNLNQDLIQKLNILANVYQSINQNLDENASQSNKLSILHEIYMKVYRASQEQVNSEQFINNLSQTYRLDNESQTNENIRKWLLQIRIFELKKQINEYEGNSLQKSQRVRALQEENKIITKFIRSYVQERYMWEQVKEYVTAAMQ